MLPVNKLALISLHNKLLNNAYKDGILAAHRTGKYVAVKDCPVCPFADGTQTSSRWWAGFGDATEDLIYMQTM